MFVEPQHWSHWSEFLQGGQRKVNESLKSKGFTLWEAFILFVMFTLCPAGGAKESSGVIFENLKGSSSEEYTYHQLLLCVGLILILKET